LESPSHPILEARRSFERQCATLRPDLHRFCARMTGSVAEGEDLVQETLVHAFYHLPELQQQASLRSWLFRIAHNRCVDLLRRRRPTAALEAGAEVAEADVSHEDGELVTRTLVAIFTELPAKERACVVLKDVLGYSLEEAAEITDSTEVAVKAALHRARRKLRDATHAEQRSSVSPEQRALIAQYLERFNQRDWAGARALLADDARLEVVGRTSGPFGSQYFHNYATLSHGWRLGFAHVDGQLSVVHFRDDNGAWQPHALVLFEVDSGRITRVRDYIHVEYQLASSKVDPIGREA
jgi:RNA polymerase sigma-70 factor (ECF subfamily)